MNNIHYNILLQYLSKRIFEPLKFEYTFVHGFLVGNLLDISYAAEFLHEL